LNLSDLVGDDPVAVAQNRSRAVSLVGLGADRLATMRSVHGADIALVTSPGRFDGVDAMVTQSADIGLMGAALKGLGIDYSYTGNPVHAWLTVLLMDVWHWTPLIGLLGYAGLRSIPDAYYQAASIDGASKAAVFWYVQLPKMRGVLMIGVLLRLMDSFMIYTEPFVLTGGGPGNSTTFLSQFLTQKAVGQFDLGPAAAFSLIYFLIILLMCFILYNWMQRVGTQEKEGGHE